MTTPLARPLGQSLQTGVSLAEKYGIRKASQGRLIPPEESTIIFAGRVEAGKSTLLGSCPTLLRIDIDKNGITLGQTADYAFDRDQPGPTWTQLEDLAGHLGEAKKKGDCPYTTVGLDSLTTLGSLAMNHVENELRISTNNPKAMFRDLGQDGWSQRNRLIATLVTRLRLSGLGVAMTAHLIDKTIPMGAVGSRIEEALDLTPGMWGDLSPLCDIIGVLQKTTTDVEEPVLNDSGEPILVLGRPKMKKTGDISARTELILGVPQSHPWAKFLKAKRCPLTIIRDLPIVGGWDKFRTEYMDASAKFLASLAVPVPAVPSLTSP